MNYSNNIKWFLRFVILIFIIGFFYFGEYIVGIFFILYLVALFIFTYSGKHSKPIYYLEFVLLLILVFHILGVISLYQTAYYDDLLHLVGSVLVGSGIYLYLRDLKNFRKITIPAKLMIVFVVSITLTLGVFWEFIEFFWDRVFADGLRYGFAQETIVDTMFDLIYDTLGALIGVTGMMWLRKGYKERKGLKL